MQEAQASADSERAIAKEGLDVELFDDVAYVALGHLHYPQLVAGRDHVRYSGSPLPLAMSEETYPHQLRIVRFEGAKLTAQHECGSAHGGRAAIPRGPGRADCARAARAAGAGDDPPERRPHLEVRAAGRAGADLRARIEAALADRPVRLARSRWTHRENAALRARDGAPRSSALDVFKRAYARRCEGEPSLSLLAFDEVSPRPGRRGGRAMNPRIRGANSRASRASSIDLVRESRRAPACLRSRSSTGPAKHAVGDVPRFDTAFRGPSCASAAPTRRRTIGSRRRSALRCWQGRGKRAGRGRLSARRAPPPRALGGAARAEAASSAEARSSIETEVAIAGRKTDVREAIEARLGRASISSGARCCRAGRLRGVLDADADRADLLSG
jgi:hypothetical protein